MNESAFAELWHLFTAGATLFLGIIGYLIRASKVVVRVEARQEAMNDRLDSQQNRLDSHSESDDRVAETLKGMEGRLGNIEGKLEMALNGRKRNG